MALLWRRLVLKVGSALIAPDAKGCSTRYLLAIANFISECRLQGVEVVLVSSGSVAAGRASMPFSHASMPINVKQAMAAIGQTKMMQTWRHLFDFDCAQILLTHDDLADRRRYLNVHNTLRTLLDNDVLPIVNENDTVATAELKVGDNDNLAALVAAVVDADLLIICSDVDGLFTSNPRTNANATLVKEVVQLEASIFSMAQASHHHIGTGGMVTKLQAAQKATHQGIDTFIINGQKAQSFADVLAGNNPGTWFHKQQERVSAKKHWLLNSLTPYGRITLDEGAVAAICHNGASVLPKGIVGASGDFEKGDAIWLCEVSGKKIAKGISQYSAAELNKIKGIHSQNISEVLGYCPSEVAVHRDDLALVGDGQ